MFFKRIVTKFVEARLSYAGRTSGIAQSRLYKRWGYRILASVCLAVLGLLTLSTHAEAQAYHAQYDHSTPAANARLASGQPPATVQVWFTEQVEPDFSSLSVYDQSKQRVDENNSHVVTSYSMAISLRPHLPDGAYTVVYQNVSLDDGHHVVGAFSFVVGGGPLPTNTNALTGSAPQSLDANFNAWSIAIRWLNYLGMAALVGELAFLLLVWRPALAQLTAEMGPELSLAAKRVKRRLLVFLLLSLFALIGGWIAMLLYQASVASGSTFGQLFGTNAVSRYLTESHFGTIWLIRLGLIVLAFLIWDYGRRQKQDSDLSYTRWPWALLLVGIIILFTNSLNSHAAANQAAWFLIPADAIHLASAGFWIGGLCFFVGMLPVAVSALVPGTGDRTRLFARLIPRFSRLAIISVVLLSITGVSEAAIQLGSWDALISSNYGRVLDLKIVLFVILLGLGAYSLLRVSPRMHAYAADADKNTGAGSLAAGLLQRAFRRAIKVELGVMILLLLIVGGLTSLSPPPPPRSAAPSTGGAYIHQGQAADLNYRLVINPGKVGPNTIEVALTDAHGKPIQGADAVIVRFFMLDMSMGVQEDDLQPMKNQPGHYNITSNDLSMAGHWRMTLIVRRTGFDDVQTSISSTFQ